MTATSSPGRTGQFVSAVRIEALQYVRQRDTVFFSFLLPPLLLVLFASVFDGGIGDTGVGFGQYFLAGIVGSIGLNVGFGVLAPAVAADRAAGVVRRLGITPMPPWMYLGAKVVVLVGASIAQLVVLLVLGRSAFGLQLPDADGWLTLSWVLVLSVAAFCTTAVAWSALIRNQEAANAVVSPVVVVLPFISGVYFEFGDLPAWMQGLASLFPLRWATLGMRAAFLPDEFRFAEPSGSWQLGLVMAVLAGWTVIGVVLCARTFRWGERG